MRIAKIILFLLKKFSLRRNLEILSVILILVVLSFSELFGLLVVKETISSITSDTNSNYAFFNILNKIFPNQYSNLERNAILLIFITLNTLFLRTFSIWYSLRIVAKADNDIATLIYQN